MKKIIKILLVFVIFNLEFVYADDFNITSEYVVLYNLNDNEVLYEKNSEEQTQIASLTKIMTTIVALEEVEDLTSEVIIKRSDFSGISEYSQAGFEVGDKTTVKDLLYGIMLPSGADAANALANYVGGDISGFVELMNKKVTELGLKNTHFDNPIGMDSEDNYSTASDVAKLLLYALENETFKEIFTTRNYEIEELDISMKSTLIGYSKSYGLDVSEILGAKSGFTDGAGLCLASIATIDDVNYLLVTIKAATTSRSNAVRDSLEIYHYYSSTYSYQTIIEQDQVLATVPIKWGKEKNYEIKASEEEQLYLENGLRKNKLKYVYEGIEELNYTIKEGTKLGIIKVLYRNEEIANYDVYLNETLEYYHPILYAVITLAIIIMIISIKMMRKEKKKKRKQTKRK